MEKINLSDCNKNLLIARLFVLQKNNKDLIYKDKSVGMLEISEVVECNFEYSSELEKRAITMHLYLFLIGSDLSKFNGVLTKYHD